MSTPEESIRQAVLRYSRGLDRLDLEVMSSAFHDDATDDHGVFVGPARELCERVVQSHRRYAATMHCVLNHTIDVVNDGHATGEVYTVAYLVRDTDSVRYLDSWWGRYLDIYECRSGRWAITHRVCVHEWTRSEAMTATMAIDATRFRSGAADRGVRQGSGE